MSLDRLIRLAQRTGDRIIIHDEFGGDDVAVLPIAEYEKLVDKIEMCKLLHERKDDTAEELNSLFAEPWRDESWQEEMPRVEDIPFGLEPEDDLDFDDDSEEDDEWNTVGDVIEDRYGSDTVFGEEDEEVVDWTPPRFDYYGREIPRDDFSVEDIPIEDIPFGPPSLSEVRPLPRRFSTMDGETSPYRVRDWEEEHLPSDEPVFYEEPV